MVFSSLSPRKRIASETVSPVVRSLAVRAFVKGVGLSTSSIVPENDLSVAQIIASLRGIEPLNSRTYPSQPTRGLGFPVTQ